MSSTLEETNKKEVKVNEEKMWLTTLEASICSVEEVCARLRVDTRNGLWWEEADQRRNLFGYNELNFKEDDPTWKKYLEQVKN